jgi:hypothetical protein
MFPPGILKLYGKLDPDTTKLFARFVAKCVSMENPNGYLKKVLRAELATTDITTTGESNDGSRKET